MRLQLEFIVAAIEAFREKLESQFCGRELIAHEKRRAAPRIWHTFLKYGWLPKTE
jgi:hypothetical protein